MAAFSLGASLLVGEVVLRAFVRLPPRRVLPEVRYTPHPVRRFTLLPNQEAFSYGVAAKIDSRGFRAGTSAPASAPTVLALGDSFTFGLGVRDEETWPAQLQHGLADKGVAAGVVNAGTISYGVFQELDLLRGSGLATRPRVVIHALYWNDFMNAAAPSPGAASVVDQNGYLVWDQLSEPRGMLRRAASNALSSSALLFSVRQAASVVRESGATRRGYGSEYASFLENGLPPDHWRPIEQFYLDLQALAARHDFVPFVVVMPVSDVVTRSTPQSHPYPVAARALLTRMGIPHLDTFTLWSRQTTGSPLFLPEAADAHLNTAGYRLVSDALAQALLASPGIRRRLQP